MTDTPEIIKACLIDDRRLELYWNRQVRYADDENNFIVIHKGQERKLVHWTSSMEWDYGTVYQKETARTTLALEEPVKVEEVRFLTVSASALIMDLEDRAVDGARVYPVEYVPYYTSFRKSKSGITIRAGKRVNEHSLQLTAEIVDLMLEKIPEVADKLVELHGDVAVFGLLENAYDIPEHRMGYWLATRHVEGFGGITANPVSTISEANVMRLCSGRYATMYPNEMILVHEFGHAIHLIGMDSLGEKGPGGKIMDCYLHARELGLWPDTYAISNHEEYFATMSTIWFQVMQEGVNGRWDGIRGPVNTREELRRYDPDAYRLMEMIYPDRALPVPWERNPDDYDEEGRPRRPLEPYDLEERKFEWKFIR